MIAAADQVTICNQALAMLGKAPLTDFNDTGDVAKHCNTLMPELIYEVIEDYDWSFLKIGSSELTETTAPTFGYDNAFTLPSGVYTIIELYDGDSPSEYEWIIKLNDAGTGHVLETNQDDDVYIKYIYTAGTTMTNWTYIFWRVVRLRLAAILAVALDGDKALARDFKQEAKEAFDMAIKRDVRNNDGEHIPYDRKTTAWHKAGRGS